MAGAGLFVVGLAASACADEAGRGGRDEAERAPSSEPIEAVGHDALFVVNGGDATISVIDTESNEISGTIALVGASYPHHLYLSADRSRMLLAVPGMDFSHGHGGGDHEMRGAVMLLDATTGATLESRWTPAMNHNAIFSPDGTEVWTSQMEDPGLTLVLDATTLATLETIEVGEHPAEVTFSADGTYAFVANSASDSVTVVDVRSKSVTSTIAVGDNPVGAWQGSNGIAYVDNEVGQTLTAIDATTLDIVLTYDLGFMPGMAAYGPDDRIWVSDPDGARVAVYEATTDVLIGEVATGAGAHAIAFDGDGTRAYASNQMDDSVTVIDVATMTVVTTVAVGSMPNGLAWREAN